MFIDCNETRSEQDLSADVCIIGSGPAALVLAKTLVEAKRRVIMIERGGKVPEKPLTRKVSFVRHFYDGILNGIAFGYGGTGALWGGQLLPMLDEELQALGFPWSKPEFIQSLREHMTTIEHWVGVAQNSYHLPLLSQLNHPALMLKWNGIQPLFSKWIPFSRRNLAEYWANDFAKSGQIQILLNSKPVEWQMSEGVDEVIESVVCRSVVGHKVTVKAKNYVVAAGALESPLVVSQMLGDAAGQALQVGRFLHDHLSVRVAELGHFNRSQFERLFAPFFNGTTMRSFRFCLPAQTDNEQWAYCHFVVEAPEDSGFAVVRDVLRGLQAKQYRQVLRALVKLPLAAMDILRIVWFRYVKQRLAISSGSRIFLNLDFVKTPAVHNFIQRSPLTEEVTVNWLVDEQFSEKVDSAFELFCAFWSENALHGVGELNKLAMSSGADVLDNIYDIYHPAGTCALGRVVDDNLKIHGVGNAFVAGSAVFPTLGRSNPTLTLMALSRRLGLHLLKLNP